MTGNTPPNPDDADPADTTERVDQSFTCVACGFATTHEVHRLQSTVQTTCLNCGDWTTQQAETDPLLEAAESVAAALEGPVLTERQALAYLLRDVVGVDRQTTAEAMETTPSNVDNLQRRGREKVAAARDIVDRLSPYEDRSG